MSLCVCARERVHLQIVLEVTSQSRGIHPETPGPHHTKTFHIPPTSRAASLREHQSGAGGEQPFTCIVIYKKVNLHLQQQQLEQMDPLTDADICSASSVSADLGENWLLMSF